MQTSVDPSILTSSPIRQLYEVLATFEANRDWSKNARIALMEKITARLPTPHQPDIFLFHSMLEDLGMTDTPSLDINENETIPGISLLSQSANRTRSSTAPANHTTGDGKGDGKAVPTLTPQLANAITAKEMDALIMLQLFEELSEQRIESWGRVARLIVTQPMDGFATVKVGTEPSNKT